MHSLKPLPLDKATGRAIFGRVAEESDGDGVGLVGQTALAKPWDAASVRRKGITVE